METEKQFKYECNINRKAFGDFEFIGTVKANSIPELKEKARKHAQSWNKSGSRLFLSDVHTGREWAINS